MSRRLIFILAGIVGLVLATRAAVRTESEPTTMKSVNPTQPMPPLTEAERHVIIDKGTERPFTGKYWKYSDKGVYVCRQCGTPLYRSGDKFDSECGWPSFDQEIPGAVKRVPDADGRRTEIECANCGAHLGHVFLGEQLTPRDTRHCVNSISLVFQPASAPASEPATRVAGEEALFAGGCFWGVDHYMRQVPGVLEVTSGFSGGTTTKPSYKEVCTGKTGHAETVRVIFDPNKVTYEALARLFFEIHDPTEVNRQGPDVGTQYRSAIFYTSEQQKQIAEKLIAKLVANGYKVVTEVTAAGKFYPAEAYHQDYITLHPERSCHLRVPRFDQKK